jgi:tetratricopeptide (TPR) repeat protein
LRDKAAALAPKADLEHPKLPLDADSTAMTAWSQQHPTNFWGLLGLGRALIAEHKWAEAKKPLEQAIALYPTATGAGGPYLLLAAAHRGLGETQAEQAFLEKHVALDADAIEPRVRLADIAVKNADWRGVRNWAEQILAINPLIPAPHRYLAQAAEALGERAVAIRAHRTLLLLDPLDRAEHHYRLAQLLMQEKQLPDARRQAVEALEEAPRYRAAHALLLEIVGKMQPATGTTTRPVTTAPATRATKERP